MAKKPETLFKERLRPRLDAINPSWWFKTQMVALRGIPDFIGCVNGVFCALELKKDRRAKVGKLQIWILKLIRKAGGYAKIVYPENADETIRELSEISKRPPIRPTPESPLLD